MKYLFLILITVSSHFLYAQDYSGQIKGRVHNSKNNQPVEFATVVILKTTNGTNTNEQGVFAIGSLQPGFYQVQVSAIGYKTYVSETFRITLSSGATLDIPLEEQSVDIGEITVRPTLFPKREESPNSLRTIGIDEIEKNPGGNRDISKVIQSFPGVSSTPAFRNDVIVRGGGPSENRFYLDGIEIPNLNHFATQGASGGPVGIINVDFIREVNFFSGAFPASRGNAMSSVLEFSHKEADSEKSKFRATVGASDLAFAAEGPLSPKTTYLASIRRSYLQLLFKTLELPFLPTYNDMQFKIKTKLNDKLELSVIGLGAIDQFSLNLDANETEDQRYLLGYLPDNDQWSYTFGAVLKHFNEKGNNTFVLSRNELNNTSVKYRDNIEVDGNKILDYRSRETENKFRYEHNYRSDNGFKMNYGADLQYVQYRNETFRKLFTGDETIDFNYDSSLDFFKYAFFGQVSHDFAGDRLLLSLGLRADGSSYSNRMSNLLENLSPRFSASYKLTQALSANLNIGRYNQLPSYTTLGYRNNGGKLVNKSNGIQYINVNHYVAGFDFRPGDKTQLAVEGFFKQYNNYPFSVNDSVSLASKGADYGVYGDEEVRPDSKGKAYGIEFLARFKEWFGFSGVATYTFVRSEFTNIAGEYIPSSWDNRSLFSITATRSFRKNWDFGFKWRYVGGAPYTPYDLERSSVKEAWDAQGKAYPDYGRFNQERLKAFHQLDLRVDKSYYFKKWSLMFYFDIQNAYNFKAEQPDEYILQTDASGMPATDPDDPTRYLLKKIKNDSGTVLPTLGIMIDF